MNQIDLHTHTTASDGDLTPTQLVTHAARLALRVIAITDHDSTDGVAEAQVAGDRLGIEVIPGVEINTDVPGSEVHMLGYFVDCTHAGFQAELARLRDGRIGRARRMAERLTALGAPVSFQRILAIAGEGAICRPHVAQALLEAGHVSSYEEAFERYIGRDGPAYIERPKFTPVEACRLICQTGGIPVLAHPVTFDRYGGIKAVFDLDRMLPELIAEGLQGIEAYYPNYDAVTIQHLLEVARRYRLIPTGGSDFHGPRIGQSSLGSVYVPRKVVTRLRAAVRNP